MKLINYDEMFSEYIQEYIKEHIDEFKDEDEVEDAVPELYNKWLDQFADDFNKYDDAFELVEIMFDYIDSGIPVPDLLCDRLTSLSNGTEALIKALRERECSDESQMIIINLLRETGSALPLEWFLWRIENSAFADEVADNAAEAVEALGEEAYESVRDTFFSSKNPEAKYRLIDIVINSGQDERLYDYLIDQFYSNDRAIYASYIAKYGDERALPILQKELRNSKIDYIEYIEIRNAIEQLGGRPEIDLSFDGEKYYEALKHREKESAND